MAPTTHPPPTHPPSFSSRSLHCSEAHTTVGYSPFICFDVADMDHTVAALIQRGAVLDGAIKYPPHGKVATLRAPDGHMLGLYEENQ